MIRKLGIIIIILFVLGSVFFAILGGFIKPELSQASIPSYIIVGKYFQGKANSDTLLRIFAETKQLHTAGKIPGTLAAVYYRFPGEDKGQVQTWAGVLIKDSNLVLPAGYQIRVFPSSSVIRAVIHAHYMVAPTPDKVKDQLYAFAAQQNLKTGTYVIEKYLNEKEIIMEIPVSKH